MLIRPSVSIRAVLGLLALVPLGCGDSGETGGGGSGGQAVGGNGGSGAGDGAGGTGATGGGGSGSGASGGGGSGSGASGGGGSDSGGGGSASGGGGEGGGGAPPDCVVDGTQGPNEECDDDNAIEGDGCDNDCTFSCSVPAADCAAAPVCQVAACSVTHVCQNVADPSQNGDTCGANMVCADGSCVSAAAVCGDSSRTGAEQCDNGNTTNLDGCDSSCRFEQDHRINYLKMQFATDATCTANRLGSALSGGLIQSQLQSQLDGAISNGGVTNMFKFIDLDDLTGTNEAAVTLGVLNGTVVAGGGYDGTNDLDWWYTVNPASIDANRNPVTTLNGAIAANVLTTSPGVLTLNIFGATAPPFRLSNARMTGTIGASSLPLISNNTTPGHLTSENLSPTLVSFATWGQNNAAGAAKLCGNVSAASLAAIPIPAELATGGFGACSQGYQTTNSLLDVIVGGCTIFNQPQITASQPDQVDAGLPAAGAGGPYTLQANAARVVTTCRDSSNAVVNLQTCLATAAYSSYFQFASGRVIVK